MDLSKINTLGILRADNDVLELIEKYGQYPDMFKQLFRQIKPSLEFKVYDVPNGEMPQDPRECDGYIITGSRSGVYEHDSHPWINQMADLVRRIAKVGVPQVGICFGHQMLACAFGGKVEKTTNKGWGIGVHSYKTCFASNNLPSEFFVLATHQDQVIEKPDNAKVIASSDFCPVAALKSEVDKYISFQGHPEFKSEFIVDLINRRRDEIGGEAVDEAMKTVHNPTNSQAIATEILEFFADSSS